MPHPPSPLDAPVPERARRGFGSKGVVLGCVLLLLAALSVGLGIIALNRWRGMAPPAAAASPVDPRLEYSGKYQNIDPNVAYVGSDRCAGCHDEQAGPYREHPMARTLIPIAELAPKQKGFLDAAHNMPFEELGSRFEVVYQEDRVLHRRTLLDAANLPLETRELEANYAIGSGVHGYSYLTLRDGFLFQTPVSWFSEKQRWDKSPGFGPELLGGRAIGPSCMFCHSNHTRPVAGSVNRYETPLVESAGIGCERCHGPGGKHVGNPSRNPEGVDYSIVNPRHLAPELRASVCEQCHLEGEARVVRRGRGLFDYRPGMPLSSFWAVFVHAKNSEEDRKAVNHVEQMYLSKCFLHSEDLPAEGKRKMGCTTCHDPHRHEPAEERVTHYRDACIKCHKDRGCTVPEDARRRESKSDSCIQCHMPRYGASDIPHTASTDHRIVRRPDPPLASEPPMGGRDGPELPLASFYTTDRNQEDPETKRDLAIGLSVLLQRGKAVAPRYGRKTILMLESALENDPNDFDAWEAKARALRVMNRQAAALDAYESMLAINPKSEKGLAGAAELSRELGKIDLTLGYWRHAVDVNPWNPAYRQNLVELLVHKQEWDELKPHCQVLVRLAPTNVAARKHWVACLLRDGKHAEAKAEFEKIERLNPPNLRELQTWFADQTGR
jgi:Tfp pilus assembly protein PilF